MTLDLRNPQDREILESLGLDVTQYLVTSELQDWPIWARGLKLLAKPDDKGIGDVIARTIGMENSAAFKAWYKSVFGKDCGCTARQADLNRKYPFDICAQIKC